MSIMKKKLGFLLLFAAFSLLSNGALAGKENKRSPGKLHVDLSGRNFTEFPDELSIKHRNKIRTVILQGNEFECTLCNLFNKVSAKFPRFTTLDLRENRFSADQILDFISKKQFSVIQINLAENFCIFIVEISSLNIHKIMRKFSYSQEVIIDADCLSANCYFAILKDYIESSVIIRIVVQENFVNSKPDLLFEALDMADDEGVSASFRLAVMANNSNTLLEGPECTVEDFFDFESFEPESNSTMNQIQDDAPRNLHHMLLEDDSDENSGSIEQPLSATFKPLPNSDTNDFSTNLKNRLIEMFTNYERPNS